ncbi:hypothetical protein P7K49_032867 [Saguinus oedipus]|uniref:Uncharacterized protein n=1 Tax=Saguinus oedipus TaxID=9490 RepID=A0ABQ9TQA3_SAGOE|nr:hypothetical protein P7K49_032867 [Saguinus oedipus]
MSASRPQCPVTPRCLPRRYMKHKRDDGLEKQEDEAVDVTPVMTCVFVVMCCSMLVLLYHFYDLLVYVVIGIFCLASATGLYSCLAPCVRRLPFGECRVPNNSLPYFHKRPQVRMLLLALFCVAVSVVWGIFRNEDQLPSLEPLECPLGKALARAALTAFVPGHGNPDWIWEERPEPRGPGATSSCSPGWDSCVGQRSLEPLSVPSWHPRHTTGPRPRLRVPGYPTLSVMPAAALSSDGGAWTGCFPLARPPHEGERLARCWEDRAGLSPPGPHRCR